jgi:hypothetical protein
MDVETAEALDRLGSRIEGLGVDLRSDMRELANELRDEMRELANELRDEMRELRMQLRAEFLDRLDTNRRHADIQFEGLRGDIRIVAEGVAALAVKIDSRM